MEHIAYITGIKSALRARGINYADLAKGLKMTESGVKKMLNTKDISFRRILQICEILDVLPSQLLSASEEAAIPEIRFSEKQEEALLSNRRLLIAFWLFTVEKMNPLEISRRYAFSDSDLKKSLQRLVSLDLVRQRRGTFFPRYQGKFRWPNDSKLAKLLNQEWSNLTLKKALKAADGQSHRLIAIKLSKESYTEFRRRLSAVFDEAVQLSEREGLMSATPTLHDVMALYATTDEGIGAGIFAKKGIEQ